VGSIEEEQQPRPWTIFPFQLRIETQLLMHVYSLTDRTWLRGLGNVFCCVRRKSVSVVALAGGAAYCLAADAGSLEPCIELSGFSIGHLQSLSLAAGHGFVRRSGS
jgi:hypothetical protein